MFKTYSDAAPHKSCKPLPLYFRPISFDELPLLIHPQPSPFFDPEDQLYEDTEDDPIPEDEDESRFTRNAREDQRAPVDYYNKWIMGNMG